MTYKLKKYKKDLALYYEKLDKYLKIKAKVFLVIKGKCTLSMKNNLAAMEKYGELEENDDVVGLLKMIKELSYSSTEVKYEYWLMTKMLYRLINVRQGDNETMAGSNRRTGQQDDVLL